MKGEKRTGAATLGNSSQGKFDPMAVKINFAVPTSEKTLKKESEGLEIA